MEAVYYFTEKINKEITKTLKEDIFMRVSYIVREKTGSRKGYFLYINSTPEEMILLEEKIKDLGAEKIEGDEEKAIIDDIKAEEDNAASGMGMIFG